MNRPMKAAVSTLLVLCCALPMARRAAAEMAPGEHRSVGVGFHTADAPLGVRWWLSGQKIGIDAGFGFSADPAGGGYPDEKLNTWALDLGVPIVMHSWDRVHVLFRPGFFYRSEQLVATAPPTPFDTADQTTMALAAEIEGEVFLVDNVSISASTGIAYTSLNPPGSGDNITSFSTIGRNFTTLGFHLYFLGGNQ